MSGGDQNFFCGVERGVFPKVGLQPALHPLAHQWALQALVAQKKLPGANEEDKEFYGQGSLAPVPWLPPPFPL